MQVARFPDVEDVVRLYLADRMAVPVSLRLPTDAQVRQGHVQVWRGGGFRTTLVDAATLNIEVRHARDDKAAALCGDAVDWLLAAAGTALPDDTSHRWQVTHVQNVSGVASSPEPRWPDRYRYIAMMELRIRGVSRQEKGAR